MDKWQQGREKIKILNLKVSESIQSNDLLKAIEIYREIKQIDDRDVEAYYGEVSLLQKLAIKDTSIFDDYQKSCLGCLDLLYTKWILGGSAIRGLIIRTHEAALGGLAWLILQISQQEKDLILALQMVDEALDENFDCFRTETNNFLREIRKNIIHRLKPVDASQLPKVIFYGPRIGELRAPALVVLGCLGKEAVARSQWALKIVINWQPRSVDKASQTYPFLKL